MCQSMEALSIYEPAISARADDRYRKLVGDSTVDRRLPFSHFTRDER